MAIVSIYDLNGVEHKRESVDARELEALGWTREPKAVDEKPVKAIKSKAKKADEPVAFVEGGEAE